MKRNRNHKIYFLKKLKLMFQSIEWLRSVQ